MAILVDHSKIGGWTAPKNQLFPFDPDNDVESMLDKAHVGLGNVKTEHWCQLVALGSHFEGLETGQYQFLQQLKKRISVQSILGVSGFWNGLGLSLETFFQVLVLALLYPISTTTLYTLSCKCTFHQIHSWRKKWCLRVEHQIGPRIGNNDDEQPSYNFTSGEAILDFSFSTHDSHIHGMSDQGMLQLPPLNQSMSPLTPSLFDVPGTPAIPQDGLKEAYADTEKDIQQAQLDLQDVPEYQELQRKITALTAAKLKPLEDKLE
ncbi:hypothetical protein P691DRAFT_791411 [Macrolepiota fuliginosa MF-IS2]|uniref:Uncharacterized protein n=1 Tax=Macrolepiota fuliginosa MF-IS2 TaxID=1400762 RepID=A0A9P6BX59_9AGAR|nr:hypothetical protein P691DRAFT_791411 [Macrolepiota fuliginosa MF-IS2]